MELPRNFRRYEIIDVIAWGGFGVIYKARDPNLDLLVALRVWTGFEGGPETREPWLREPKRHCSFRHPNIVSAYDAGELDGSVYLAMELIAGESLDSLIRNSSPLSLLKQIDIVRQISGALQFAHEQGVIHRDVKPGNILVSKTGTATLVGLTPPYSELINLECSWPVGTIAYMAPEMFNGDAPDGRSDVFSLGCTFYELVEGRRPFEGDTLTDVLIKILRDPPLPSTKARDLRLPELQHVFDKGLAKEKNLRYQSCAEFSWDLDLLRDRIAIRGEELLDNSSMQR